MKWLIPRVVFTDMMIIIGTYIKIHIDAVITTWLGTITKI